MIRLTLPWPPSVNTYWRHNRGRTHISAAGRRYRADVWAAVASAQVSDIPLEGRVRLTITAHPPDRRRRDLDNLGKAVLDALEFAGVFRDDAQVDDLRIVRGERVRGGRIVVELEEEAE